MPFWKKRRVGAPGPLPAAAPEEQPVEHAVLIHITSLPDADIGLDTIEDPIIEALERSGVGEFDGNEIGPDGATLYMYGPDADSLWAAIEDAVRSGPFGEGSYAVKRHGPPGAPETRIPLS